MVVAHNLLASNANRMLGISTGSSKKTTEKLSSGYKINRAADDAAGLTISEKMRSQIRGLTQASANAQDGVSFVQTADGTLDEVSGMLKRSKELAVKASTETLTEADRKAIQEEVKSINAEIDRVQQSSTFNDFRIFIQGGFPPSETDVNDNVSAPDKWSQVPVTVSFDMIDAGHNHIENVVGTNTPKDANNFTENQAQLAAFVQGAVNNAVTNLKDASAYGGLMDTATTKGIEIGLRFSHYDGKGNTLAQAESRTLTRGSDTTVYYTLHIDMDDYDPDKIYTMNQADRDAKLSDLAATIAHEMTHIVMMDTMPRGISGSFPEWFIEGTAQTSSGDGGWVARNPSDNYLRSKIKDLYDNPYGTGYIASMYLGHLANDKDDVTGTTINSNNIKSGLNKIFKDLAAGSSMDDVISKYTNYGSLADFEKAFVKGDENVFQFAKSLMNKVGSGAGSLLGSDLSKSQADVFPASVGTTSAVTGYYNLNTTSQTIGNTYNGTPIDIPTSLSYGDGKGRFVTLQVGAANKNEQRIKVKRFDISCDSLFEGHKMDMSDVESSRKSLAYIDTADANVSAIRSYYGAIQNRLEHTIANLDNVVENTTAAESLIRDTDMAKEMVEYTKTNVLIQAGNAMLSQAMRTPENVLQLLQ